jgi:tetratricopeptide (TPR) repeat protein
MYIDKGNALYAKQDFRSAAVTYKHACMLDSVNFDAWYNFGNALYKLEKYILAGDAYNKALQLTSDSKLQAQTLYNVGNAYLKQDDFENAIEAYTKSLLLNPAQPDCRYNLSYALKLQELQQKDKNNSKNNQNKQKNPQISEFAQQCKAQADTLVAQYKFSEAYDVMKQGLAKDKTVAEYSDFIQRLQKISEILENKSKP